MYETNEYRLFKKNIYAWIRRITDLKPFPVNQDIEIKEEKFIIVEFGTLEEKKGIKKPTSYKTNENNIDNVDGEFIHYYNLKLILEFHGEGGDYEALKLAQSSHQRSTIQELKVISLIDIGIDNTSTAISGAGYEERYRLSFDVYFGMKAMVSFERLDSLNASGKIKI